MKITNLTKNEIITCLNNNDEEFINQLYDIVRKYCWKNKIYSEDNVQDLICGVLTNIHTYDETKSKFTTWVYIVCCHTHWMNVRKSKAKKRESNINTLSLNTVIDDDKNIEILDVVQADYDQDEFYKKEIVNYIYNNCLSKMTKDYIDGKTQEELATEYGISQAQISRKINKELKRIKGEIDYERNKRI